MNVYLIEGISWTGKTAVCKELARRGFEAIEADEIFGYYGDPKTGKPTDAETQLNWLWDTKKVKRVIDNARDPTFICGGAMNQKEHEPSFTKVFTLCVSDGTLAHRLLTRTNNSFGKDPQDLARQIEWNKGTRKYSNQRGTVMVNAEQPIKKVVDDIIAKIEQV
jgi:gluconate kinase